MLLLFLSCALTVASCEVMVLIFCSPALISSRVSVSTPCNWPDNSRSRPATPSALVRNWPRISAEAGEAETAFADVKNWSSAEVSPDLVLPMTSMTRFE